MTKRLMLLPALLIVVSCATEGDFCDIYEPVYRDREDAGAVFNLDPDAARKSAGNNSYYEQYCL